MFQGDLRQLCEKMAAETDFLPNSWGAWWSCDCSLINKSVFLMYLMNRTDVLEGGKQQLLRELLWARMSHLGPSSLMLNELDDVIVVKWSPLCHDIVNPFFSFLVIPRWPFLTVLYRTGDVALKGHFCGEMGSNLDKTMDRGAVCVLLPYVWCWDVRMRFLLICVDVCVNYRERRSVQWELQYSSDLPICHVPLWQSSLLLIFVPVIMCCTSNNERQTAPAQIYIF